MALIQKGNAAAAVPLLTHATEAYPSQARGWAALGVAYAAQGKYDLAEPPFARACELQPKVEDACYYDGRALYALGRFEASVQALEKADRSSPDSWKIRLGIAQALEALGRAEPAEKAFRRALALGGLTDSQPGAALGLFFLRQGRSEEAVATLTGVLQAFPSCAQAHLHLGRALLEQDQVAQAIPHLEEAAAAQPESAQAHLLLAKAYTRAGRVEDAQSHFQRAAKLEESGQIKER